MTILASVNNFLSALSSAQLVALALFFALMLLASVGTLVRVMVKEPDTGLRLLMNAFGSLLLAVLALAFVLPTLLPRL
jgi:hypothetical protein